jgi:urea transport system permease protein
MKMNSLTDKLRKLPVNRHLDTAVFLFLLAFPFISETYWIYIMSGIMAYMLFALSLDLLWGYTGLLSMGHSLLFGAGGYMVGISCAFANKADWIEFDRLPWFLAPLAYEGGAFVMAILVPGLISLIIGFFMFSGKIKGVFFSLITLALSGVAELFVINQSAYTHGNSGISIVSRTVVSNSKSDRMSDFAYYFVVLLFLFLAYLFCRLIANSRVGKVLQAVRENESRLTFFGFKPSAFKLLIYTISGMLAGLAGVLYVRVQGSINSTAVGINLATLVLIWVAVGGRGNLTGAMVGTLVLQILETKLISAFSGISADFVQYWKLVLGILILLIVFLIPKGIVGTLIDSQQKHRDKKRKDLILQEEEGAS